MFASNVAPKRRLNEKREPWVCQCIEHREPVCVLGQPVPGAEARRYRLRPGYLVRCTDCGTERP